jgi:hypothetical protein
LTEHGAGLQIEELRDNESRTLKTVAVTAARAENAPGGVLERKGSLLVFLLAGKIQS